MDRRNDQRIMLTRQLLQTAFLSLLKIKPIHRISIRELCEKAGINRTTFYNHYGSQYDLLEDICQSFLNSISACLSSADTEGPDRVQQRVTLVLRYIADNHDLSALLINNSIDPTFAERLFSLQQIHDLLDAALVNCIDARERAAIIAFAIHGSYKLLGDWINSPDPVSPEEQTALMLRLARRVCGDAAQNMSDNIIRSLQQSCANRSICIWITGGAALRISIWLFQ